MPDKGSALHQLNVLDPELALEIETHLAAAGAPVASNDLKTLVDDTLWALSQEIAFGKAVARGYAQLLAKIDRQSFAVFRAVIRKAGRKGPTVGKILATHLVPVFLCRDAKLVKHFLRTYRVMSRKGTYTLRGPFAYLSKLLDEGDIESGYGYLALLRSAYNRDMSYNQSLQLTYTLPKAVSEMPPSNRCWLMKTLSRIVAIDLSAAECFLAGLRKGLGHLHQADLNRFVSMGLARCERSQSRGCRFLSLGSRSSREICDAMQVAVPLVQIQNTLSRYVRTRTGRHVAIRPTEDWAGGRCGNRGEPIRIFSEEGAVYLPAELDVFDDKQANRNLYLNLVKFESACLEYGTFDFDADKTLVCFQSQHSGKNRASAQVALSSDADTSELERFYHVFDVPELAADLFNIFEHTRQRLLLSRQYPGLVRRVLPIMQREMKRIMAGDSGMRLLNRLYARIALDLKTQSSSTRDSAFRSEIETMHQSVNPGLSANPAVETCGVFVLQTYDHVKRLLPSGLPHIPAWSLQTPFGRRIKPDGRFHIHARLNHLAASIQSRLRQRDIRVYRMDVRNKLAQNNAKLSQHDLKELIAAHPNRPETVRSSAIQQLRPLIDVDGFDAGSVDRPGEETAVGSAAHVASYHEWDCRMADYLPDYVRVVDRTIEGVDDGFYANTLGRYHGLVQRMRHAFELLRPQGMSMMRPWHEGDQFDYRALVDFAVDRHLGRTPSDRLYIKREKRQRDVAVLVLVDLSRSTSNFVDGANASVLDIEKSALVLLSEALAVAGDRFALVGFSGSGRFCVDYWRIKDFSDRLDHRVHCRINAIAPLRSTRMGAAIRHAAADLARITAKVRLLLVLTDGYPNDVGYKQAYAQADTHRAVFEAHARQIFFKAIVVNLAGGSNLDALYGKYQHALISNIQELPDKLLRIYGTMTRM